MARISEKIASLRGAKLRLAQLCELHFVSLDKFLSQHCQPVSSCMLMPAARTTLRAAFVSFDKFRKRGPAAAARGKGETAPSRTAPAPYCGVGGGRPQGERGDGAEQSSTAVASRGKGETAPSLAAPPRPFRRRPRGRHEFRRRGKQKCGTGVDVSYFLSSFALVKIRGQPLWDL